MCYDVKALLGSQLKRARQKGNHSDITEIQLSLAEMGVKDIYHASGFSHPKMLIYTNDNPDTPTPAIWGLIPFWVKDNDQRSTLWNQTLNARVETIFEKPSFRDSAKSKRCLIIVDGFYEHHHFKGNTYPFYIMKKNDDPMIFAGLWSNWLDKESGKPLTTFSIVTTQANQLMSKIHNNPKLPEPRMPAILLDEFAEEWLNPVTDELDRNRLTKLIGPYPNGELLAHTVKRLKGKDSIVNDETASEEFIYPELVI